MRRTIFVLAAAVIGAACGASSGSNNETGVHDGGGARGWRTRWERRHGRRRDLLGIRGPRGKRRHGRRGDLLRIECMHSHGKPHGGLRSHQQTEPDGDASRVRRLGERGPGFVLHPGLHDPANAGNDRKLVPDGGHARRVQPLRAFSLLLLGCSRSRRWERSILLHSRGRHLGWQLSA